MTISAADQAACWAATAPTANPTLTVGPSRLLKQLLLKDLLVLQG